MPSFNKETLDAYRKIICRELEVRSSSSVPGHSGSLTVYGIISGAQFQGVSGTGIGDMLKSVYDTDNDGIVDTSENSNLLSGLTVAQVRTHSPDAHATTHVSGSSDPITIYKNQISDINDLPVTTPQLLVTGSNESVISGSLTVAGNISGSSYQGPITKSQLSDFSGYPLVIPQLIVTGSSLVSYITGAGFVVTGYITGAEYYGPTMHVRTGSGTTTYARRRINFVDAGGMIISMTDSPANDEVLVNLQSTGSGGGGASLSDSVVSSFGFGQNSGAGVSTDVSRADHVHGTPSLYVSASEDVGTAGAAGSNASGSHGDHVHRGVLSFAASGSTDLYGRTYITGSTPNIVSSQSGQTVQIELGTSLSGLTNVTSTNVTGSTILSGATIYGANEIVTNLTATNVTGSTLVSGSTFRGPNAVITNLTSTYITGSTLLSGADIRSPTATITYVNTTNLTGSNISGSLILGPSAIITNVTASNITGSTLVSGADFRGPTATIGTINVTSIVGGSETQTNITASYITGSTLISGSLFRGQDAVVTNITSTTITGSTSVSGSSIYGKDGVITNIISNYITGSTLLSGADIRGPTATITSVTSNTITGSTIVSGASIYGETGNITNFVASTITGSSRISGSLILGTNIIANNITGSLISGSTYQGNLVTSIAKSGSSAVVGDITLEQGNSIALTQSGKNIKFDVTVGATIPSDTVTSETAYGASTNAGLNLTYSRGDHTHGSVPWPAPGLVNPLDIGATALSGSSLSSSAIDHVHRGVLSLANSGSSALYSRVYLTGAGAVSITQSGQVITLSGSTGTGSGGSTANKGYVSVSNGGTIAHGLGVVPTWVGLSASGSTPVYFSHTSDATNITVYHTVGGSLGVFWRAEA